MGALFLARDDDPAFAASVFTAAEPQFARHGFRATTTHSFPGWRLLHAPYAFGGPDTLLEQGDDLIAVAGTFAYDGMIGRPALQALLAHADLPRIDWSRIAGQFVALVRKAGRSFLFTDYFGAFQIYHDPDRRIFSTSLLSAAKALPRLHFDVQGIYEYAFNIFPTGDDSVFAELKRLGPGHVAELTAQGVVLHDAPKPLPEVATDVPLAERLATHRDRLMAVIGAHVGAFGDNVHAPLSGGLDSRLLLAALRAGGSRPQIYVYGSPGSEDVRIAKAIGAAEGFEVEWIEKAAHRRIAPDEFANQVERNFHECDAIPNYGGLFDNGGNEAARKRLHAGGALAASGGCGEVYRDFFFLRDRPTSARTLARSFYARYARGDLTSAFDEDRFLGAIEDKILAALGRPGDRSRLSRLLVEQVYPRVRCRAFFGREISLVAREGAYLMPFLDHNLVEETMTLPIALKQAGTFEAALLNMIDPSLARQPSAYGHDFTVPPSFSHRASEWSTRVRPAWLRQRSYEIQRRLRPMRDDHAGLLSPEYMGRVIDLGMPAMRPYFHVDRIADSGLWQRLACLQYVAEHLGSRLVPA
jgi:hypothetical protein